MSKHPKEPTSSQCSAGERVEDFDGRPAYAYWYPQMGGYVGKCVVVADDPSGKSNCCFEAFVWHDGTFPFPGEDEHRSNEPRRIHHCAADQFIEFGRFVLKIQGVEEGDTE